MYSFKRKVLLLFLAITVTMCSVSISVLKTTGLGLQPKNRGLSLNKNKRNEDVITSAHAQYDIFINSYMRSGSSFLGKLLTSSPDIFYWYEPLWNIDSGIYYSGNQYICVHDGICGEARNKTQHNIGRVHAMIGDIFTCKLRNLEALVAEPLTPTNSGHHWREYTNCRKGNISVVTCLQQMEEKCNSASHRVVKSVRLTLDILEHFLENYKTLKVIHLIRDPRAIMNSRITTKWFGLNETTSGSRRRGRMNAKALCTRLKEDLIAGVKLKQKYPDRFAFVLFEDLLDDLKTNAVILYSYFNIKGDNLEGIVKTLMNEKSDTEHSIRRLDHSYTDWWRFNRNLRITKITEDVCKNVMKLLGYESYETIERRLNSSFQRFDFNPKLLVRHILKNDQYESIFDF